MSCRKWTELGVFADASTMAIAAVAYLHVLDSNGKWHVGFVMGKSKLAPCPMYTVPRLELCAAVLAVELAELIHCEMDIDLQKVRFFTDSHIALGYIHNSSEVLYLPNFISNLHLLPELRRALDMGIQGMNERSPPKPSYEAGPLC